MCLLVLEFPKVFVIYFLSFKKLPFGIECFISLQNILSLRASKIESFILEGIATHHVCSIDL